jgi:hypothetical protein
MKINTKTEYNSFWMKQNDVTISTENQIRNYKDEDDNIIYAYNSLKMDFYVEEDFKLGYM